MSIIKKIWGAILLVSLLALGGCPEVAQQGGDSGSSRSSGMEN